MKTPIRTALVAVALIVAGSLFAYRGTLPLAHAQGTPAVAAFASASRASGAFYYSGTLTPPPGTTGVMVQLNVTSCTSGCGVTETFIQVDPLTGSTSLLPSQDSTATTTGNTSTDLLIYPGITTVTNRRVSDRLVTYPVPIAYKLRANVTTATAKFDSSVTWVQ